MIGLLLAALLTVQPVAEPAEVDPTEVDPIVVELPRPEKVFCVRYYRASGFRAPRMTCKTWIEWRAIKGSRHDTRTRTGKKLLERGLLMDSALQDEAVAGSIRPPAPAGR